MTAIDGSPDVVAPHWVRCEGCAGLLYAKRFARMLKVCPECSRHGRLTAPERLEQLLDPGSAEPVFGGRTVHDPLEFVDSRPYPERLRDARADTGLSEAVVCASGLIEGQPVVVAVMDFRFLGGSLGCAVGETDHAGRGDQHSLAASRCWWSPPPAAPGCRRARCR